MSGGVSVAREMAERDQRDRTRAESPLVQAPDAIYVDSTGLTIEEVEEAILKIVRAAYRTERNRALNNLLVMKFGGTSMGSAERMRVAARICRRAAARSGPVVAWSRRCPRSPTCCSTRCGTPKPATKPASRPNLDSLRAAAPEDLPRTAAGSARREPRCAGIQRADRASSSASRSGMLMLGERPPRSVDEAVAIGERLSALLMAEYLEAAGHARRSGERRRA